MGGVWRSCVSRSVMRGCEDGIVHRKFEFGNLRVKKGSFFADVRKTELEASMRPISADICLSVGKFIPISLVLLLRKSEHMSSAECKCFDFSPRGNTFEKQVLFGELARQSLDTKARQIRLRLSATSCKLPLGGVFPSLEMLIYVYLETVEFPEYLLRGLPMHLPERNVRKFVSICPAWAQILCGLYPTPNSIPI